MSEPPSPAMLGTFSTLAELQVLARARAEQLNLSRDTIDEIAGFADGHAHKLLCPKPQKKLGELTLPLLLGALAMKLVVMDDPERREQIASRYPKRNANLASHSGAVRLVFSRRFMRKIAKKGGQNSRKYMTKTQKRRLASKAGKIGNAIRWAAVKAAVK